MRKNTRQQTKAETSPLPLFDWATLRIGRVHAHARALDREADAALFYGRAKAAERLSTRAAELREAAR